MKTYIQLVEEFSLSEMEKYKIHFLDYAKKNLHNIHSLIEKVHVTKDGIFYTIDGINECSIIFKENKWWDVVEELHKDSVKKTVYKNYDSFSNFDDLLKNYKRIHDEFSK